MAGDADPAAPQGSAFAQAAAADFDGRAGEVFLPELGMALRYRLASAKACRRAMKEAAGDDIVGSAILVRDHVTDAAGEPIVSRDRAGLDFLLERVRPDILGRLAKLVGGQSAAELGND